MITEYQADTDSSERILLYEIWRMLKGDQKDEVQGDDLRVLLLCILHMKDSRRIGVAPTLEDY